ncbi:hypothetical protein SLEP1_g6558 [Rubroshorea leprosula]|uniref:Uncharacterized protein n=1 Tax=Rubroshorea leprosula TaxID=152421 RepID=A0AAV5I1G3_9ROSI|nr:hypothetical protein SLEP1_g6558 [Rubroshorea leprosula]
MDSRSLRKYVSIMNASLHYKLIASDSNPHENTEVV